MRPGCGCALVTLGLGAVLGGAVWAGVKVLQEPGVLSERPYVARDHQPTTTSGGNRATLTMSETDLAVFITRQLNSRAELPVRDIVVRLPDGNGADVGAKTTVQDIGRAWGMPGSVFAFMPHSWRDHPVWVTARAAPRLGRDDSRRYLRVDVSRFAFGRLPLPTVAAKWVGLGLLHWELPDDVEDVRLEPGRVTVRISSSRLRTGPAGRR